MNTYNDAYARLTKSAPDHGTQAKDNNDKDKQSLNIRPQYKSEMKHFHSNEYEKLKVENTSLNNEIGVSRQELEEVNQRLNAAEARLKQDALKQRAQHLREEKT